MPTLPLQLEHVLLLEHIAHQARALAHEQFAGLEVMMPAASWPRCCSTVSAS
jgi:hypothetical protein